MDTISRAASGGGMSKARPVGDNAEQVQQSLSQLTQELVSATLVLLQSMGLAIPLEAFLLKPTKSCITLAQSHRTSARHRTRRPFLRSKVLHQPRHPVGLVRHCRNSLQELTAVTVNRGDSVALGQVLARLDSSTPTGRLVVRAGAGN